MADLFQTYSFEDFWKIYPRHVGKRDANKAWDRIVPADHEALMDRLREFISIDWQGKELNFVPHPATWLRAKRWEDESCVVEPPPAPARALADWRNYTAPTEEERLEGIRILRECREKLTANDMRLKLKTIAVRRKK